MPILSAEALEQAVINAVFVDVDQPDGERLREKSLPQSNGIDWCC
jgi:hypothetical protein